MLPNFLVIGAYKSGTTSLHRYLRMHPDVFIPHAKEPNFFAHEEKQAMMAQEGQREHVISSMDDYRALFAPVTSEQAIGEVSPIYLGSELAAQRVQETLPDVRLIAILRQPVDAFLSDHNMRIRDQRQLEAGFRQRVDQVARRLAAGEMAGPVYGAQLQLWYDRFDHTRIRVYLFEDLKKSPGALMQDMFGFLNVDPAFEVDTTGQFNPGGLPRSAWLDQRLTTALKRRRVNAMAPLRKALQGAAKLNLRSFDPISADLRSELTAVFQSDIEHLQALIGRDLSHWL